MFESDALERIGVNSFAESGLEEITLPNSVVRIESGAFQCCKMLKRVTFPMDSRLAHIGSAVFLGSGIDEFIAPKNLKEIEHGTFSCCNKLRRIVLNEGLKKLGAKDDGHARNNFFDTGPGVFEFSELEEIVLPSTLTDIGTDTFKNCSSIRVIWTENCDRASIRRRLCSSVVVLPERLTALGGAFLRDLRREKDIVLPEDIHEIGEQWFKNTDVESVIVPASVKTIGEEAFQNCKRLKHAIFADGSLLEVMEKECF